MKFDDITIIIPMYNCEATIEDAVKSIIFQNADCNIILVNDGSTDNTLDVALNIIEKNKSDKIKLYNQENRGPSAARNKGIEKCITEYICFLDADDKQMKETLEMYVLNQRKKNTDCVIGRIYYSHKEPLELDNEVIYIEDSTSVKQTVPNLIKENMFNSMVNKLYKTEIIKNNGLRFNESINIGEDFDFNLQYINFCNSLSIMNSYIYEYKTENSQLTKKIRKNDFYNRIHNIDNLKTFYEKNGINSNLDFQYVKIFYSDLYNEITDKQNKQYIKNRIAVLLKNENLRKIKLKQRSIIEYFLMKPIAIGNIDIIYVTLRITYFFKNIEFMKKNQISI